MWEDNPLLTHIYIYMYKMRNLVITVLMLVAMTVGFMLAYIHSLVEETIPCTYGVFVPNVDSSFNAAVGEDVRITKYEPQPRVRDFVRMILHQSRVCHYIVWFEEEVILPDVWLDIVRARTHEHPPDWLFRSLFYHGTFGILINAVQLRHLDRTPLALLLEKYNEHEQLRTRTSLVLSEWISSVDAGTPVNIRESYKPGEWSIARGRFHAVFEEDLNLVVYENGTVPVWSTQIPVALTSLVPLAPQKEGVLVILRNGDVQIRRKDGLPLWSTFTNVDRYVCCGFDLTKEGIPSRFELENDGTLVFMHQFTVEGDMAHVWRSLN